LTRKCCWRMVCCNDMTFMMDETLIRVAIRTTARASFVLFLGAFLGEAAYRVWPTAATLWLKVNKGRFTLGFAGSHTVHLVFILALVAALGRAHLLNELGWGVLTAFTTGFLFIYALAVSVLLHHHKVWLTSPRFVAFAQYFLITLFAFAFALSGLTRPLFYAPFVLAAIAALGVRITAAIQSRKMAVFTASAR
jgi:sulfoxide reductase heme-binding subunit YedZ